MLRKTQTASRNSEAIAWYGKPARSRLKSKPFLAALPRLKPGPDREPAGSRLMNLRQTRTDEGGSYSSASAFAKARPFAERKATF